MGTLTQLTCSIFLWEFEKCFKVRENVQKYHIFVYSDNPGQVICHKVKESTKIGQDFKNVI